MPSISEVWKDIPSFRGYQVSNLGRFRSLNREIQVTLNGKTYTKRIKGRLLKVVLSPSGYSLVELTKTSKTQRTYRAHRIVAKVWLGNCPKKLQVNHKNGIKSDNRISNLEYVTASENRKHAFATGLSVASVGEDNPSAKLTEKIVKRIRRSNATTYRLAKELGIGYSTIKAVRTRRTWTHV